MCAQWTDEAKIILDSRYLKKDKTGKVIESPDDMLIRVATVISKAEKPRQQGYWQDKFFTIMDDLEFLPNSPTLMNAGRELGQLSACFLISIEDQMEAILEAVKRAALIHKSGGGTGLVFSKLRPNNSMVGSTSGVASGPVSFMKMFDICTEVVKQGGVRRGANLGMLLINHPDIENFINCKNRVGEFENFNVSVAITDSFMRAVKNNNGFDLKFRNKLYGKVNSRDLLREIAKAAHKTGDPGVFFIDVTNKLNPAPWFGYIEGTNPCGELPLLTHESCNLGSIDVSKFVKGNNFDYERLSNIVSNCIRFLDDIIIMNKFPNAKIRHKTLLTKKVGLGVMGFADALLLLNVKYGSQESLEIADRLMSFINVRAHEYSQKLGEERGYCDKRLKRRNTTLTTIAPTGTLSILANCSSSIEPIFAKDYTKTVLDGKKLDLSSKYIDSKSFVTAYEVEPKEHILVQSVFQKHVDNSVSKTINLKEETTPKQIEDIFKFAYDSGCKGLTIFREGSRAGVLESTLDDNLYECDNGRCSI